MASSTPEEKALRLLRKHWDWLVMAAFAHLFFAVVAADRPGREAFAAFFATAFWAALAALRRAV
jgi:hypothetical protein